MFLKQKNKCLWHETEVGLSSEHIQFCVHGQIT